MAPGHAAQPPAEGEPAILLRLADPAAILRPGQQVQALGDVLRSGAGMAAYTASKAAVAAFTVALSEEVAKEGILINAVAPSIMDTPANRAAMPKANYELWPKVEEVASTIVFLASPENKVTRAAIVPVYGCS